MPSRKAVLVPYPATPCPAVAGITVEVRPTPAGELCLAYRLEGAVEQLEVPEPLPPGPADGLWEHTCFEAFIAVGDEPAYREFNFSTSGQWAAYAFSGYRQRDDAVSMASAPTIAVRRFADRLDLEAVLPAGLLPPNPAGTSYHLGLSAVIEAADGSKSYWALAHPGPRPDFHQRAAFILDLAPPDERI